MTIVYIISKHLGHECIVLCRLGLGYVIFATIDASAKIVSMHNIHHFVHHFSTRFSPTVISESNVGWFILMDLHTSILVCY